MTLLRTCRIQSQVRELISAPCVRVLFFVIAENFTYASVLSARSCDGYVHNELNESCVLIDLVKSAYELV